MLTTSNLTTTSIQITQTETIITFKTQLGQQLVTILYWLAEIK